MSTPIWVFRGRAPLQIISAEGVDIMKKLMIVSLVAAGLTVAACGKKEEAVEANATELNEAVATEGTANDTMTNVDAAAGNAAAATTNAQ